MQMDLAAQPGVDNTGNTECGAAVQTALNSCAALGIRAFAKGIFKTASTLTITAPVDLTDLTVKYSGNGTAILVGTTNTTASHERIGPIRLPHLIATAKTVAGWAQVAGTIGVQISNVYTADIFIPRVSNFETGLKFYGAGQGVDYLNVFLGHLENNKVNCLFDNDATGWTNQNQIYGGRMSHGSEEGTLVAGTRHVKQVSTPNVVNSNSFYGTSMESPDVVEYIIETAGIGNTWYSCRFENSNSAHNRVLSNGVASRNTIAHGYGSEAVIQVTSASASAFNILSGSGSFFTAGFGPPAALRLQNDYSSVFPALLITGAGEAGDPNLRYGTRLETWKYKVKTPANTNDAIVIDGSAVSISFGNGSSEPDVSLTRTAAKVLALGATNVFKTGQSTTASRPNAASVGVGAQFYDTTLHKPIWSDGVTWRDASGAST
jgi:hypothetical protein